MARSRRGHWAVSGALREEGELSRALQERVAGDQVRAARRKAAGAGAPGGRVKAGPG